MLDFGRPTLPNPLLPNVIGYLDDVAFDVGFAVVDDAPAVDDADFDVSSRSLVCPPRSRDRQTRHQVDRANFRRGQGKSRFRDVLIDVARGLAVGVEERGQGFTDVDDGGPAGD